MGAPQAKENTPRYIAGVPTKSRDPRTYEIDQLVRFGDLTELCVSASLPPDLTSMEVSETNKNLKNKRSVTISWHKRILARFYVRQLAHPYPYAA